jgi:prepilin-type N-terminal cleavage/methylation domain-containing protein
MRRSVHHRASRGGFTLVELLIVITIIGILATLTTAAVIKAIGKGDELKLRNEISQLSMAVNAFKVKYQVPFLPGGFLVKRDYVIANPVDQQYLQYLRSIWPRIGTPVPSVGPPTVVQVDWGAANNFVQANANGVALDGNQTLVLFLGGVGGLNGLSEDSRNPFGGTNPRALYDFSRDRLRSEPLENPFPRYLDLYGTPYVYFSSGRAGNDYPISPQGTVIATMVVTSSGTFTVYPFQISGPDPNEPNLLRPRRWANPTGFQIISAGKDGLFHDLNPEADRRKVYAGGLRWGGGLGSSDQGGADNIANFHPTLLGVPAN